MSWLTLNTDDLKARFAKDDWTALGAALHSGQSIETVAAEVVSQVTNRVRGYVGARYPLGPAGTVPQELEEATLAISVQRLIARLKGTDEALFTEARQQEYKSAQEDLEALKDGTLSIVADPTPAASQPISTGTEMAGPVADRSESDARRATREKFTGL